MDIGFDVGARLKAIRSMYDLSQRELAKRAGVTNSTISLIEQNRVSPSVSSLKKVLDGIPMTLAEFFTMDLSGGERVFFSAEEMAEVTFGALTLQMVGGNVADRQVHMMREVYNPGGDTGSAMISYDGEEAGLVIEGRVEITVGDITRELVAGESYYFDTSIPHRFRNLSDAVAVVVSASTNAKVMKGKGAA